MNIATPALGPSFGVAPAGTWTWMSFFSKSAGSMPSRDGAALDQGQRSLRALAHHVAKLAGEDQAALARHARGLDEQDVAADRRPGQASRDAGHAGPHRDFVLEARLPEERQDRSVPITTVLDAAFGDLHGGMAQRLADLALEIADAGLARVAVDDQPQRFVVDLGLLAVKPLASS